MLDGQGCLLPVRHFRREDTPLLRSSCSDLYKSFCVESSAESSPNPSAYSHPQHSGSDAACPCSLDAFESNNGEIITANLCRSVTCHCLPVSFVKIEPAQAWDSHEDLAKEVVVQSMSSELDCLSTGNSSSVSPRQKVGTGTSSIHGELDEVSTSPCVYYHTSLEISRSGQVEERHDQIAPSNEMPLDLVEASSCNAVAEEESEGTDGEAGSNCGADNFEDVSICKYAEVLKGKEPSRLMATAMSLSMSEVIGEKHSDIEHNPGLGCIFPKDMKEVDDSSSQSACTEEVLWKEHTWEFSAASSEFACASGCKRLRISNNRMAIGGSGSLGAHKTMPSEGLHDDNANHQQQPYLPGLDNESALRCFAFVRISDLGRLAMLGRQYRDLVNSRLIFKLRRMYGMVEHRVFIYASGAGGWTVYNANRNEWKTLPPANVNPAFNLQDRESLSAGTHVLWLGKEMFEFVYYRYDLVTNSWERGPSMVNPRCLFASASCGEYAYVAGGFGPANNTGALTLLNSAERYNSVTGEWERLPPMSTPRHKCSGFFMDGKFYVIGGRDANHQPIMSGEEYNPVTGLWRTIPNMYFAPEVSRRDMFEPSPPLVAVVNNHLYAVENTTNKLKMYNKQNNTWSNLGDLPVRADLRNGWGVAFKALGNRLFVMGDHDGVTACCWQPGPDPRAPAWTVLYRTERDAGCFLYNCAVMTC